VENWFAGKPRGKAATKALRELTRLLDALSKVTDAAEIGEWLREPNEGFGGSTPMQIIERGEADQVYRMIFLIESGQPD